MVKLTSLTCEHRSEPLGIDITQPRLSWQLVAERRGARQTAYQLLVGSTADGVADLWDSGRVESCQSVDVVYQGTPLTSRQRCWWRVRVWDELGEVVTSESTWWEMGLLTRSDWRGAWIGGPLVGGPVTTIPNPYLRRGFTLAGEVATARLYVACLGLHDCTLNGQPVGEDVFSSGWTDFNLRVRYQVYDIANLLKSGENALGVILGDGWYCGRTGWNPRQRYSDPPRLLAQLEINYRDGQQEIISSDTAWRCNYGPLLGSDLQSGESYDARLEMPGWDTPDFDDTSWCPVKTFTDSGVALVASNGPLVRRIHELSPIDKPTTLGDATIYNLGQNMVGRVRIRVTGKAGVTVRLRFAERLQPDGSIYTTNLRSALATDHYTLRGDTEEIWESRFTFHGFQYVEVKAVGGTPVMAEITGVVLHSAMTPTGEFSCSNPLVNQLQHNIQWGQKGNFLDVPTDCPQRDERLGWMGDAQVFAHTAAFNMDVAGFFDKWLQDLRDGQFADGGVPPYTPNTDADYDGGPGWSDAAIIVPWTMYLAYGNTRVLREHYQCMARHLDFLTRTSRDYFRGYPDMPAYLGFGDWLSMDGGADLMGGTSKEYIGTAFYAYSARLLGKIAHILGFSEDATRYTELADNIRTAFQQRFLTADGILEQNTQTACVLALHFELLPTACRAAVAAQLVANIRQRDMHLATGFLGTPYLMHVLTETGYLDVAYALLEQQTFPSWLYPVTQGATTIWERWDGWTEEKGFQDPSMNSFNHYGLGAIGDWLYSTIAGIKFDPNMPGYQHAILRPRPGGTLTAARGALQTRYGLLESDWHIEGNTFTWKVTVPPNSSATAYLPTGDTATITEGGVPAATAPGITAVTEASFTLAPGSYHFTAPVKG